MNAGLQPPSTNPTSPSSNGSPSPGPGWVPNASASRIGIPKPLSWDSSTPAARACPHPIENLTDSELRFLIFFDNPVSK
jgi:hypothetical protein